MTRPNLALMYTLNQESSTGGRWSRCRPGKVSHQTEMSTWGKKNTVAEMITVRKNRLSFLNNQLGFCGRSSVVAYAIAYVCVNYLAKGSSSDQRLATGLEAFGQKAESFQRLSFQFFYPL